MAKLYFKQFKINWYQKNYYIWFDRLYITIASFQIIFIINLLTIKI